MSARIPSAPHDCLTDARCCKYCETHEGCRCGGDHYDPLRDR